MTLLGTRAVMIGAGAVLVLETGSTAAYAALAGGPVDGSGVIHGCWTNTAINGTHVFVLQDAGTTCPKGTTAISWNQQGPTGPAWPSGPSGSYRPGRASGRYRPGGAEGRHRHPGASGAGGRYRPGGSYGPGGSRGTGRPCRRGWQYGAQRHRGTRRHGRPRR
jgi:hypothetical protein